MAEIKIKPLDPIEMTPEVLAFAEAVGGIGVGFQVRRMTREELEAEFPGASVPSQNPSKEKP